MKQILARLKATAAPKMVTVGLPEACAAFPKFKQRIQDMKDKESITLKVGTQKHVLTRHGNQIQMRQK